MGAFNAGKHWLPRMLGAGAACCILAGCLEREVRGDQSIYHYAWWVLPSVIAACLLGMPIGWLIRKWSDRLGKTIMTASPIILVFFVPAMHYERVVVDAEHFETSTGFWFVPSVNHIRFDDLQEINWVARYSGRSSINELRCVDKNGGVSVVYIGTMVSRTLPEIFARAQARGVPIIKDHR